MTVIWFEEMEIWITTKIEPNVVFWTKFLIWNHNHAQSFGSIVVRHKNVCETNHKDILLHLIKWLKTSVKRCNVKDKTRTNNP